MDNSLEQLDRILEAALLAAGEPMSTERLAGLFDEHERPACERLQEALSQLESRLQGSALELVRTASGHQVRIRQCFSPWVSRLWEERPQRYSRALLETLALIAYRQPVTRADIEDVRGVTVSSSIMRTLTERGWVRVVGHRDVPGRPSVYATTRQFLDDFGLETLDALPPMHELKEVEAFDRVEGTADTTQTPEVPQSIESSDNDATVGMTDADQHAGMASDRPRLSFADLEARLAERAQTSVDDDGRMDAETSENERSDDP
ncbi:SMC-Scp complex subunit ScpB [Aidingimonas halophila]|uniref:Segregation and condensation protein B n=1 Tax=Aidingimonas halophila TaxID=574349 RepID=A0A1H2USG1_9GAMM|nr:SMC-Scp complex subunit ScpB [Aidingimonas halophila]GHC23116.1 segregation and condensation protein B [Aidingimonas halophila]SDW59015.1 segregation and condensation protein B [Aidingimonas halophila]